MAPGCARRKYPEEEGLTCFKTNAREFMEIGPWSAFSAPRAAGRHGTLSLLSSGSKAVLSIRQFGLDPRSPAEYKDHYSPLPQPSKELGQCPVIPDARFSDNQQF